MPRPGLDDRRIHAVQLQGVVLHARIIEGRFEREVGEGGHLPHAVGDHEREALLAHPFPELEQRARFGAWGWVVQSREDARVEPANTEGVLLEVLGDHEPGAGRQDDQTDGQRYDDARGEPAEGIPTHGGPGDRSPDRARAPRESGRNHPPAGRSPAGR